VPEPYWLPDWALVPAKTGPRAEKLINQQFKQSDGKVSGLTQTDCHCDTCLIIYSTGKFVIKIATICVSSNFVNKYTTSIIIYSSLKQII
jgi:hypothetical protein